MDKSFVAQGIVESVKIRRRAIVIHTRVAQTSRVRAQPFLAASFADILTRDQLFTLNVVLTRSRAGNKARQRRRNTDAKRS